MQEPLHRRSVMQTKVPRVPKRVCFGTECVSHVLQTLVESDARTTLISIDDIGAFDLVSRNAMLRGLKKMDQGDRVLPFVRRFYGQPSGKMRSGKCRTYLRASVAIKVIRSCQCSSS